MLIPRELEKYLKIAITMAATGFDIEWKASVYI